MTWLVIINNRVEAESSSEEAARAAAAQLAAHGAIVTLAQKLAECRPDPQPQWTENGRS